MSEKTTGRGRPVGSKNSPLTLDYSTLEATTVDAPLKVQRESRVTKTPFVTWLSESHRDGVSKVVTVPSAAESEVKNLIRSAARHLNVGVRIASETLENGDVRVAFQGKEKRAYNKTSE